MMKHRRKWLAAAILVLLLVGFCGLLGIGGIIYPFLNVTPTPAPVIERLPTFTPTAYPALGPPPTVTATSTPAEVAVVVENSTMPPVTPPNTSTPSLTPSPTLATISPVTPIPTPLQNPITTSAAPPTSLPLPTSTPATIPAQDQPPPTPTDELEGDPQDDFPVVSFTQAEYTFAENVGQIPITVTLTFEEIPPSNSLAFDYITSDGLIETVKINLFNYLPVGSSLGNLTLPFTTKVVFTIPVLDDIVANEAPEMIRLALVNPINVRVDLNSRVATLTIRDDEGLPQIEFGRPTYQVSENALQATINVTSTYPSAIPMKVVYMTRPGTALAGRDYYNVSGSLTITEGFRTGTFTVPIIGDLTFETNEVLSLTLGEPVDAGLGLVTDVPLTILDECTLPDAIAAANTDTAVGGCAAGNGLDTIVLLNTTYPLTKVYNNGDSGLPAITSVITIEGNGATVERNSADQFRIFRVNSSGALTLNNLTVRNGNGNGSGGGILNAGVLTITNGTIITNTATEHGGGIANTFSGIITITNSTIEDNRAGPPVPSGDHDGGGVYNNGGKVIINDSEIIDNIALNDGGGIANVNNMVAVSNSTISDNRAEDYGGGIYNENNSTMLVINSTINDNEAVNRGGGIANQNNTGVPTLTAMTINNSTISNNRVTGMGDNGGGIGNLGILEITNSTISFNTTPLTPNGGGGIAGSGGSIMLKNSIIANNNPPSDDCAGINITSSGYNLDSDNTCNLTATGDIPGTNPNLNSLGFYDPDPSVTPFLHIETHALITPSLAIDAIPSNECTLVVTDQRGVPRPQPAGGACDIGAFELQ